MDKNICQHCGQELQIAAKQRKEIHDTQVQNISDVSDALIEEQQKVAETLSVRQDKLDLASQEMLEIIQRIETKVGADEHTLHDVKELEARIRAKVAGMAQDEDDKSNQ